MKQTKFNLLAFTFLMLFFTNCSEIEKELTGCTDPDSINYNENAIEDDGSCKYEGQVVFWYDRAMSQKLVNENVEHLRFFVDNKDIANVETKDFWNFAPDCNNIKSISIRKYLGDLKSKTFTFSVIDEYGQKQWEGTIIIEANTCTSYKLTSDKKK